MNINQSDHMRHTSIKPISPSSVIDNLKYYQNFEGILSIRVKIIRFRMNLICQYVYLANW